MSEAHGNPLAAAVAISWRRNGAYGVRLIEDLEPALFVAQPVPEHALNHPAWVLSHLNLYAGIAVALCRGEPFDDPAEHRYGQKSIPLADATAYASKADLIAEWTQHHEAGEHSLCNGGGATIAMTSAPNPLERWRALHPTVGDMLVTLMVKHESGHLGQLSAWRRAMGLARVAV